ncbi:MAG: hypothetical protein R2874_13650 [Desulfobacterales bacterium]
MVNQKTVLIRIMESEKPAGGSTAEHAVEIKTAVLNLPPNLPADLPIEITFTLNEEGRLHITAMETSHQGRSMWWWTRLPSSRVKSWNGPSHGPRTWSSTDQYPRFPDLSVLLSALNVT